MGVLKNTHAWSVAASVVLSSIAVGFIAMLILTPRSRVATFMVSMAIALIVAVGVHVYTIYRYEKDRLDQHKKLSKVDPQRCPDYWTEKYDPCSKSAVCKPFFQTENPAAPKVFMNGTSLAEINVRQHSALGPQNLCASDAMRQYPWMEISNSCDAKNRAV
nr:hypothetical protein TetV2_00467 [Oceanusvirus sp.]